jgi:hypothetical protein
MRTTGRAPVNAASVAIRTSATAPGVELNGPTMMARIGVMKALNRNHFPAGPRGKRTKAYTIIPADEPS